MRILAACFLAPALPLFAGATPARRPPSPAPRSRPSLLLITLDTTRADHLGCYGYKPAQTPNLDALAARGLRFENAYASAPITLSSHSTMMTGTFPPRHGARDNGLFKLNSDVETLAEVLKKNGYQTAAFVSAAVLDRQFGLNRGFDHYDDNVRTGEYRAFSYQERAANQVTEAVINYLPKLKASGKPFFLWVHYYDAHYPYVAPNPFKTQFRNSPYDGEIAFVDANLGELFEEMKSAGLDRNLYTVAVGDHGEMLGEHGERNHGVFLYKSALHVPLIIAGPGIAESKIAQDFVGLVHVKTLVETALGFHGKGLSPDWPIQDLPAKDIYEETFMPYFSYGFSPLMGLRTDQFHYIEAPQPELYDLSADPGETRNLLLAPDGEKLHGEWSRKLADFLSRIGKGAAASREKLPVPNASADPELLKSLAQLGYVGNAGGGSENLPDPKTGVDLLGKMRQAEALKEAGKTAAAIPLYEEVLRRTPNNFNTYSLLANARLETGQPQEALRIFRAGLKLNPRLEFLRLGEAGAMAALNDPAAEAKYRALARDNPRNADAGMTLGDYLYAQGRIDDARAAWNAVRAAGHDDAELRYRIGRDEWRGKRPASAQKELSAAIAFNKYHAEALALLAEIIAGRDPAAAAAFYRRAIEERPERTDWRQALAALGR